MKYRFKGLIIVSLILALGVLIFGCAKNPKGSFGPSWDVPIRVPLAQNKSENINSFLEEDMPEEVVIPRDSEGNIISGELLSIEETIDDSDTMQQIEIGQEVTNITLPDISTSVDLPAISCSLGNIDDANFSGLPITGDLNNDGSELGEKGLTFEGFDSVTFSDNSSNEMTITVTNNSDDYDNVTVERLEFTFEDSDNNQIGNVVTFETSDGSDIPPGESRQKSWDLANQTLPNSIDVNLTISTDKALGDTGEIDIAFGFPGTLEISEVTNLSSPGVDESLSFDPVTLTESDFETGLKEIGFTSGSLGIEEEDITNLPSGLTVEITNMALANLSDTDNDDANDGLIPLTDNPLDLTQDLTADFDLRIISTGDSLTYDAQDTISINGGFNNAAIEYVKVNWSDFPIEDYSTDESLNTTILEDKLPLPEEAQKIKFNDPVIKLLFNGIEGLNVDLSNIEFQAVDSEGQVVTDSGGNEMRFSLWEVGGVSTELDLLGTDPDFLALLQHPEASAIEINGSFGSGNLSTDEVELTIYSDSQIGLEELEANLPLSISITEDISRMTVDKMESLDSDNVDMIQKGVKEFKLMLKDVTNELPLNIEANFYLASVPNGGSMDDETLQDTVCREENILPISGESSQGLTIKTGIANKDKELFIETSEAERFTEDDLYFGIKLTIPETAEGESIDIRTGDEISIREAFAVLTTKVNQLND